MITGAYYALLLHRLSEEIKKKRLHLKKILFHQDNARVHTCAVSMVKIMELKFELLQHSPDFDEVPKCYFLDSLKKLEKRLKKCIELKEDYVGK